MILASIQARLGSSRLPKKVLKKVSGVPLLQIQIERIRHSRLIDKIVLATTTLPQDDELEDFGKSLDIEVYRGPENDVLTRINDLLLQYQPKIHLEFRGDSPFPDPFLINELVGFFLKKYPDIDYLSNDQKLTYPVGLELNAYKPEALAKVNKLVERDSPLREHVTLHMTSRPDIFKIENIEAPPPYFWPDLYLEVDTQEDFDLISAIYQHFTKTGRKDFTTLDIIDYLRRNPALASVNKNVERRWLKFKK